jgi:hypothetical protein
MSLISPTLTKLYTPLLLASITAMFPMSALASSTSQVAAIEYDGCKAYENPSGDIYVLCENETKELLKEKYIPTMRVCGKRCVIIITDRGF